MPFVESKFYRPDSKGRLDLSGMQNVWSGAEIRSNVHTYDVHRKRHE